jgi:hypothetical protein
MAESPVYQEIKNTLIDGGLKNAPFLARTHSPRRATIKTRWGMKEIEVVSSQASTADTTEALPEDGPEQLTTWRPSVETYAPRTDASPYIPDVPQSRGTITNGQPQILNLEQMLGHSDVQARDFNVHTADSAHHPSGVFDELPPQLGSPSFPSIGSIGHHMNRCKPCAFVSRTACGNGVHCNFCHLCEPGEKKRRRKEKKALITARRRLSSLFQTD